MHLFFKKKRMVRNRNLFVNVLLLCAAMVSSQMTFAHGYISHPESRSLLCKENININCGPVQWEPQSVEGPDRFPETGPADGTLASAGLEQFSKLNEQTANRWHKLPIQAGKNTFSWHFTANHASRDWRYFITRDNWNPNEPLSRASFDLSPFCVVDGNNQRPPVDTHHTCYVPQRSGYHIILGVWDVGDTPASFYQAIDVMFEGDNPPPIWRDIGDINPSMDLAEGDKIISRVFNANGEQAHLNTELLIANTHDGLKNNWPKILANKINSEHTELIAGVLNAQGNIIPVNGKNDIYVAENSPLERVEIQIDKASAALSLKINNVQNSYSIIDGKATLPFHVSTNKPANVRVDLFDSKSSSIANANASVNGNYDFNLVVNVEQEGQYTLAIKAETSNGELQQKSFNVALNQAQTNEYDYIYPDNAVNYKEGTKVLAADGKIYQCKPFPYSGWCTIYSNDNNAYAPGSGAYWQDAWSLLSL